MKKRVSLSTITLLVVVTIVTAALGLSYMIFMTAYSRSMYNMAITSSNQAVAQTTNTVSNYLDDMREIMTSIEGYYDMGQADRSTAMSALVQSRDDVIALYTYDSNGQLLGHWTSGQRFKDEIYKNLSYVSPEKCIKDSLYISSPHVESTLDNYYPWVVSIGSRMTAPDGRDNIVVMDIKFSKIAEYIDAVGIGSHGYCFIMDMYDSIIYHPQQQLIYSGLKIEDTAKLSELEEGSSREGDMIYSISTIPNSGWKVVGVTYMDEIVASRISDTMNILLILIMAVVLATVVTSIILSHMLTRPARELVRSMEEFEHDAASYRYEKIRGAREITALSESFDHMVKRIQNLMDRIRKEEVTLRKTELKALQAQINPHFLYNTLDAIGWMCEEDRSRDAVEMVNSLARLFRISISKGHELIPISKEIEHAQSYLMIQKYRYKDQFTYEFHVDESLINYMCNKITLQPIIENAIYHGLDRMVDEGQIDISILDAGEDIIMEVRDNGIGMTQEQIEGVLVSETEVDRPMEGIGGIGIKNVNDRLKIYFGEKYGISISSEVDEGTTVRILMPKIEEGSFEERS